MYASLCENVFDPQSFMSSAKTQRQEVRRKSSEAHVCLTTSSIRSENANLDSCFQARNSSTKTCLRSSHSSWPGLAVSGKRCSSTQSVLRVARTCSIWAQKTSPGNTRESRVSLCSSTWLLRWSNLSYFWNSPISESRTLNFKQKITCKLKFHLQIWNKSRRKVLVMWTSQCEDVQVRHVLTARHCLERCVLF